MTQQERETLEEIWHQALQAINLAMAATVKANLAMAAWVANDCIMHMQVQLSENEGWTEGWMRHGHGRPCPVEGDDTEADDIILDAWIAGWIAAAEAKQDDAQ